MWEEHTTKRPFWQMGLRRETDFQYYIRLIRIHLSDPCSRSNILVFYFTLLCSILASLRSVKAVLLPTTCPSSKSLRAKRHPSTKPCLRWESWWTKSSASCPDRPTLWSLKMWSLQVESKQLKPKLASFVIQSIIYHAVLFMVCCQPPHLHYLCVSSHSTWFPTDFNIIQ